MTFRVGRPPSVGLVSLAIAIAVCGLVSIPSLPYGSHSAAWKSTNTDATLAGQESRAAMGLGQPERSGGASSLPLSLAGTGIVGTLDLANETVIPGNASTTNALSPYAVAFDPVSGDVYVASVCATSTDCWGSAPDSYGSQISLTSLNASTGTPIATVPIGRAQVSLSTMPPNAFCFDTGNGEIYVAAHDLVAVDATTGVVSANIPLGYLVEGVTYASSTGDIYASSGENVSVIDGSTNSVLSTLDIGRPADGLAYSPADQEIYVSDPGPNYFGNVTVINPTTLSVVATVPLNSSPRGLVYNPINQGMYVSGVTQEGGNITVISNSSNSVGATIRVGSSPFTGVYDPDDGDLYFSGSTNVTVINGTTNATVTEIPHSYESGPFLGIAFNPLDRSLFAAQSIPVPSVPLGDVAVINGTLNQVVATDQVGSLPGNLLYDGNSGDLYVIDSGSQNVSVVDPSTGQRIASIYVPGLLDDGLVTDSSGGDLYVLAQPQGSSPPPPSVTEIDTATNTVAATWSLSGVPYGLGFDPSGQNLYVLAGAYDNVTVVNATTGALVEHIVLASGDLRGSGGILYDPSSGEMYVSNFGQNGDNLSVINATQNTLVGTVPCGPLLSGTGGMTYDPTDNKVYAANPLVTCNYPSFNLSSVPQIWAPDGEIEDVSYDSISQGLVIAGPYDNPPIQATNVSLLDPATGAFAPVDQLPFNYSYPSGFTSDSADHLVYISNLYSGAIALVNFSAPKLAEKYAVTFQETGLPTGATWSVNLSGTTNTSTTSSIGFEEPNGTNYPFTAGFAPGFAATPSNGTLNVTGAPVVEAIAFARGSFFVTFTETGLPFGTNWSVTGNGSTQSSTTNSIVFTEPKGTFNYSVATLGNWTPSPSAGNVTISGAFNTPVAVSFIFIYLLTFDQPAGTPSGTTWSVTLSGPSLLLIELRAEGTTTKSSTGPSIGFNEPNGTYSYAISVTGYPSYNASGSSTISGDSPVVIPPPLASPSPPPGRSSGGNSSGKGTDPYLTYGIVGAVIVALLIGETLIIRRRRRPPDSKQRSIDQAQPLE